MLAIKCTCPEGIYLPLLTTILKNKRPFIFTHCVSCGKNITWMSVPEEKIKEDSSVEEISQDKISPEEMAWYEKKLLKGKEKKKDEGASS